MAAQMEWSNQRVAMLPLGSRFDAVRMPVEIVHAAAASSDWQTVSGFLAETLNGPVIHDPYAWYYALVPPRTTVTWTSPFSRCVGRGAWLGVPRTDRLTPRGPYWAVPMERAGDLCSPAAVAALVQLGHGRLTEAAR
ncbi:hypothetical protein [Streptomyces chryseus]|uniref:hypothetical protein n=1 Tax=Streptomyces chryseus TaxID=68186 RepID=UPI001FCC54E7|nr:hypothetical protein [Streptomyces chryseus]